MRKIGEAGGAGAGVCIFVYKEGGEPSRRFLILVGGTLWYLRGSAEWVEVRSGGVCRMGGRRIF